MSIGERDLLLLNAYHDGELSPGEFLAMEQRLQQEPELAAMAAQLNTLSDGLHGVFSQEVLPEQLRSSILATLPADIAEGSSIPSTKDRPAQSRSSLVLWQAMAACLAIGLVLGTLAGGYFTLRQVANQRLDGIETAIVAAHLRGLMAPQPFDIASSDNHVVKPWFNGRTPIAPTAPDFADAGFPLVGGRIDIIEGEPVPTLIYKRARHTISVTVTSGSVNGPTIATEFDGTHLVSWHSGDLTYWAVSDVNMNDLTTFADLYRAELPPG